MPEFDSNKSQSFLFSRSGLVLTVFLVAGGFLLWEEHSAHLIGVLPLILILGLCLGMHFFMHGGHGGSHDPRDSDSSGDVQ